MTAADGAFSADLSWASESIVGQTINDYIGRSPRFSTARSNQNRSKDGAHARTQLGIVGKSKCRLNAVHTSPAGEKLPHLIEVCCAPRSTAKLCRRAAGCPISRNGNQNFRSSAPARLKRLRTLLTCFARSQRRGVCRRRISRKPANLACFRVTSSPHMAEELMWETSLFNPFRRHAP